MLHNATHLDRRCKMHHDNYLDKWPVEYSDNPVWNLVAKCNTDWIWCPQVDGQAWTPHVAKCIMSQVCNEWRDASCCIMPRQDVPTYSPGVTLRIIMEPRDGFRVACLPYTHPPFSSPSFSINTLLTVHVRNSYRKNRWGCNMTHRAYIGSWR